MSSGGGNSLFESLVDVGLQVGTAGLVGVKSEEGGLSAGVTGKPVVKGVKDVTGATAAEEANKLARDRFEQERADIVTARGEAKSQTAADQLAASRQAGGARAGRAGTSKTPPPYGTTPGFGVLKQSGFRTRRSRRWWRSTSRRRFPDGEARYP